MWPAPLKFISDLNPEARTLLEKALITANMDREKEILKDTMNSFPSSPVHSDSGAENDISEVTCLCVGLIYLLEFSKNFKKVSLKCQSIYF